MMQALEKDFPVRTICNTLGVSKTAYYRFCQGESYQISNPKREKLAAVDEVFWEHKRGYGSRRMVAELQEEGYNIGPDQVRTLMKVKGLQAIQPKSFVPKTTDSRPGKTVCKNLLLDQPLATAPNRVWVGAAVELPQWN